MRHLQPSTTLAGLLGLDIALLLTAAALTPKQNPALPLELSVLLAGLIAWLLVRRSRAAAVTAAVFTALLLLLSLHILVGDAGEKGASELVPDVLIIACTAASLIAATWAARGRGRRQQVA